jgi:hypothetical protein
MAAEKALKRIVAIVLITVLPLLPGFALSALGYPTAVGTWALAALMVAIAALLGDVRIAIFAGISLSIASFFGYLTAENPWLAMLVMAVSAAAYGLCFQLGIQSAVSLAPIALAFTMAQPTAIAVNESTAFNALLTALLVLGATAWALPIGWFFGKQLTKPALHPVSKKRAHIFAALLASATGVAMWFVSDLKLEHGGAWFLLTLFVVIQPRMRDTWRKSLERALGTILGFGIAFAIGTFISAKPLLYAMGFICVALATWMFLNPKRSYWQYATFLTPGIVILEGTGSSIQTTDLQRLQFTLLGVGVALVLLAVLRLITGSDESIDSKAPTAN